MVDDNQHPLSSAATTDALAEAIAAKVADPAFAEFKKRMPELNEVGLLPVIKLRPTAVSDWIVVLPSGHQILLGDEDWKAARIPDVAQASQVASAAPVENKKGDQVHWLKVNDEPFEYAIQQGPHGDEFVKLLNGECLRRPIQSCSAGNEPVVWRVRYCGQWMYFENKAHAEIYAQGDDNTEPLYLNEPQTASKSAVEQEMDDNAEYLKQSGIQATRVTVEGLADWFYDHGWEFVVADDEEVVKDLLKSFDIAPKSSRLSRPHGGGGYDLA
jgi:hypothetical protein